MRLSRVPACTKVTGYLCQSVMISPDYDADHLRKLTCCIRIRKFSSVSVTF